MMNKLTESQKIILKRKLLIPSIIRHLDIHNSTLKNALKLADEYKLFAALFTLASLSALVSGNIITSSSFWIFLALALNPFFERYET